MYRKQMTPGMKACKDKYGGKNNGKKDSPYNYSLEMGAGQSVEKVENTYSTQAHALTEAGKQLKEYGM